ncbi:malonyl-ACP O-methyltransferase BioC [uncultured Endozoicomonas sp.]|uniref:malonyl-ACP O-methyltransferase BioC n=1 Tax=uncultured Endozoicomonas sp. TaxID=432652 RepID=UPI0026145FB3|nr:malonyl-ACP O-methyltransferase BioC [uncultured Endozoicomonas sp.]
MSPYSLDDYSSESGVPCSDVAARVNKVSVKRLIARNFGRAAQSYDAAAVLQHRVAARAMLGLPTNAVVNRVLDLGSGTGIHSVALADRYASALVTGLDLSMGMLQFAQRQHSSCNRVRWCSGDIESLPFASESIDLIFSSLAIQWCSLERVLDEVSRVLKPGGQFVFSTLSDGSLHELNASWTQAGESGRVNQFAGFSEQQKIIHDSGMRQKSLSLQAEAVYYPDVSTMLRSLKALGVNTVLDGTPNLFTRRKLDELRKTYEHRRVKAGLPLTYQVLYGVLNK